MNAAAPAGELPEHVRLNRAVWDQWAVQYAEPGERAWATAEPTWGIWDVPESDLQMLPADMQGQDAIELGCGTAYVSAWMARRGARVVGIDNSAVQLATAARLQRQHNLAFTLLHGNAETVPCAAASFDFAISEYGASLWADPQAWVAEAARLLRRQGFEIEDLIDVRAPTTGRHAQHSFVTREWARQWPSEEVWKVRLRG